MDKNVEVLIIGAGPTGLMMACQLLRFNVKFRILDKNKAPAKESRAFGIQAKSMEIFQNLGIVDKFLERMLLADEFSFYANGSKKGDLNLNDIKYLDTPFKSIFVLPQSETETILINFLARHNIKPEREVELTTFTQQENGVIAEVKHNETGETEQIYCDYIVGCDGAHSTVREILNIPFAGQSYHQDFVLADVIVEWPFPKHHFFLFLDKIGLIVAVPLKKEQNSYRLVLADLGEKKILTKENAKPSLDQVEKFLNKVTHSKTKVSNPEWMTFFHLHHRSVKSYQKNRAFLAGDAAHIHSPVGAQGMNTGLQDAANLAWKLALVLKYNSSAELLSTYHTERQRIGEILMKTTDRLFGFMIKRGFLNDLFREHLLPMLLKLISNISACTRNFFLFVSETAIHYHENSFTRENTNPANKQFLQAPKAGFRAPDAPLENTTLFDVLKVKPFNILLIGSKKCFPGTILEELRKWEPDLINIHFLQKEKKLDVLFKRYGLHDENASGIYFIRPDGYIGFRSFGCETKALVDYLKKLFGSKPLP